MTDFNPNNPGVAGKIFGLSYNIEEADIVLLPVPWDVTASYNSGTVNGPQSVLDASFQIDYSIPNIIDPWKMKVSLDEISANILTKSQQLRTKAEKYIRWIEEGKESDPHDFKKIGKQINQACTGLENQVFRRASQLLERDKIVGCLGGDHSTPLGLINALSKKYDDFGILQIDAHMDLRSAYEGFVCSHASIMFNALKNDNISKLVQVGIRDYCHEESEYMSSSSNRVITHYDQNIKEAQFNGELWKDRVDKIISTLPKKVYISFDIDGLSPHLCPNTGTPVPGGLSFNQATFLIKELVRTGRQIIGFDLSEVAPGNNEWDANVGSRLLYQLCAYTGLSQGKLKFAE